MKMLIKTATMSLIIATAFTVALEWHAFSEICDCQAVISLREPNIFGKSSCAV